jgi:hypothetical protein
MESFDWIDWPHFEQFTRVAPLGTATIALIAVIIAFASLKSQAKIARKRAAIDFFIRTELDPALREAYHDYVVGLELSKECSSIDAFKQIEPKKYQAIRTYLDINDLICIGINEKVLHQRVCYGFWYNIIRSSVTEGKEVIDHARAQKGYDGTYDEILRVGNRWFGTAWPWQRWRVRRSRNTHQRLTTLR